MISNKTRSRLLGLIAATSVLVADASYAADSPATALAKRLRELYPNTQFTAVAESPLPGFYEVTMGRNIAYTDDRGRYFLFGHLFDMPAQRDLTAERKDEMGRIDFTQLPLGDAIKTVHGAGSRVVAVFSDPDCPYCKKLEPELAKIDDVTIYTYLMPLTELHPDAKAKAISIWCGADRAKAWSAFMLRNQPPANANCEHPVERNLALAERFQITGTPTLIASDGRVMPGAASAAQIEAWLGTKAKSVTPPQANKGRTQ